MSEYPKPNPVCVPCGKEMRCEKNGVIVENGAVQWRGDKFKCPKCGVEVVAAFGGGEDIHIPVGSKIPVALKGPNRVFVDNL